MSSTQINAKSNKKNVNNATKVQRRQRAKVRVAKPKPVTHNPLKSKAKFMKLETTAGQRASGVRRNIMVQAQVLPAFVENIPLSLISRAVTFGTNSIDSPVYWVYLACLNDWKNAMAGEKAPVSNRLKVVNDIIQSWAAKTVPFKVGTMSYSWLGVDSIAASPVVTVRGFNTYLYVPSNNPYGPYQTQVAPSNPSSDTELYAKLSNVYSVLADSTSECLKLEAIPAKTEYDKDVSAFAPTASYFGQGCVSNTGPSYSVESEIPFKSRLLAGTTSYRDQDARVARVFGLSSGDAPYAIGYSFLPKWRMSFYRTAYPPINKYLDLDEVVYVLQAWYLRLVAQYLQSGNGQYTDEVASALSPFECSAQDLRIAIRQSIASFFATTWGMCQTNTYATDANGFEPFRSGTNTAPINRETMRVPLLLLENLRMLLPAYGEIPTKYYNEKNVLAFIPVWGLYRSTLNSPLNLYGTFVAKNEDGYSQYTSSLCVENPLEPPIPNVNPIDGRGDSNECVDLNSAYISSIIEEWNQRVAILQSVSIPTAPLAGSSAVTILTATRYSQYREFGQIPLSSIPKFKRNQLNPKYIKKIKRQSITKGGKATEDDFYVPPGFSLETQVTRGYGSMQIITEEVRQLMQYLIYPTEAVENDEDPIQRGSRTHNLEGEILDYEIEKQDILSSRASQLNLYAGVMAPGIATAGKSDELTALILKMSENNQGGFLGDLLTGVATVLLPQIPI